MAESPRKPLKPTAPRLKARKFSGDKIVCLTAYDAVTGALADESGADLILVGDSVGNVVLGYPSTVHVNLSMMLHHVAAVRRGVKHALLVGDLPFGSYNQSVAQAVESGVALMQAGAEAVKLEGDYPEAVAAMVKAGIPVMGHLGFTPQSVNTFGGHRVQGRDDEAADIILAQADRLAEAGVFAIVLELMPAELAARLTQRIPVPTIGIGAGLGCDGEIQVFHDVVGLSEKNYKHARAFVQARALMSQGLSDYVKAVKDGTFPTEENSF